MRAPGTTARVFPHLDDYRRHVISVFWTICWKICDLTTRLSVSSNLASTILSTLDESSSFAATSSFKDLFKKEYLATPMCPHRHYPIRSTGVHYLFIHLMRNTSQKRNNHKASIKFLFDHTKSVDAISDELAQQDSTAASIVILLSLDLGWIL
jgi:hypothetical protein